MPYLDNDGVLIAYTEYGEVSRPPMLLLHGLGLDRTSLAPQARYFSSTYRVIAPDLRGHGESAAPRTSYEVAVFARDMAALCEQLGVTRLVVVGHSMGGNIALSFAQLFPSLVSALCLIDSALFIPDAQKQILAAQIEAAVSLGAVKFFKSALERMCLPAECLSKKIIEAVKVPDHVLTSALPAHTVDFDSYAVTQHCTVPLAYIHSIMPFLDLDALRRVCPQVLTAATLGSGHLSPLEVPDQINAMLSHFIHITLDQDRSS